MRCWMFTTYSLQQAPVHSNPNFKTSHAGFDQLDQDLAVSVYLHVIAVP